jgi:16S rRNA pseudouridine516 synthase
MSSALRLDQLLSRFGYCSRREAAGWLSAGRITWEGEPLQRTDQRVTAESVLIDGQPVEFPDGLLVMLHKPIGYACSHDPAEAPLIYDLLPPQWMRRNPGPISVGRLDRETSGLLLITDDGALSHRLTSPKHEVEKTYEVTVSTPFPDGLTELFASGTLTLRGEAKACLPARLEITGEHTARLFLHEGKYHQVRRMFASQGCPVTALHRSAIGGLALGDSPEGQWCGISAAQLVPV